MRAAVHIADFGFPGAFRALVATPKPAKVPGLRSANSGLGAALGGLVLPIPSLKRVVMVSFWDDDASIDAFEASHPAAERFTDGWSVRLEPLRAFGTWPGLDTDVAHSRIVEHDGEVVVLTLGRLKLRHSVPFFRASNKAERSVIDADGLRWATGFASPRSWRRARSGSPASTPPPTPTRRPEAVIPTPSPPTRGQAGSTSRAPSSDGTRTRCAAGFVGRTLWLRCQAPRGQHHPHIAGTRPLTTFAIGRTEATPGVPQPHRDAAIDARRWPMRSARPAGRRRTDRRTSWSSRGDHGPLSRPRCRPCPSTSPSSSSRPARAASAGRGMRPGRCSRRRSARRETAGEMTRWASCPVYSERPSETTES